jgi:HAD superfamily phosphoserine phosphatase-like hydrolase
MDNKVLVLVDFDHTLYKGDSLLDFTKYYKGIFFYINLALLFPKYLFFKVGFYNSHQFKEMFLIKNFRNEMYMVFCNKSYLFSKNIDKKIDKKLLKTLQEYDRSQHDIYIVTASFSEWILPWAVQNNFKVIASKLEIIENRITGKIAGKNCNYEEKVIRIKEEIKLDLYSKIFVFGNGKGDFAMMKLEK